MSDASTVRSEVLVVVGAGTWGTTLAWLLARQDHPVRLWHRSLDRALDIELRRVNAIYLPGVRLPDGVGVGCDLATLAAGAALLVLAVPTSAVRHVVRKHKDVFKSEVPIVSATKGIEPETGMRISEVLIEELGADVSGRLAVLSGPNLAMEILGGQPTATVLAARDESLGQRVQRMISSESFRAYTTTDVVGVELAGALKNVVAIACGIVDGLGLGNNARGALITRGLAEITRLGVALGANPLTFLGLSGVGDLVATCTSSLSRNHTVGHKLAQGQTLDAIRGQLKMVAEGIGTTRAALRLASRKSVAMPITQEIHAILFEGKDPRQAIRDLMLRELRSEVEVAGHA